MLGQTSDLRNWRSKLEDEKGFAPKAHYERLFQQKELYFASVAWVETLGNGPSVG